MAYDRLKIKIEQKVSEKLREDFIIDLRNFYNKCIVKYSFLLSREEWEKFFETVLDQCLDEEFILSSLVFVVNEAIKNTLRKNLRDSTNFSATVDGMINNIDRRTSVDILKEFVLSLEDMGLDFDNDFYTKAKNCPVFRMHLKKLGILDFNLQEFRDFTKGYYANYLAVRPSGMTIKQLKEIVDYLYGVLGIKKVDISSIAFDAELESVVRFIVQNYPRVQKLHSLYQEVYGPTSISRIDKTLLSMSRHELELFFEQYYVYENAEADFLKDLSFLYKFSNRVNSSSKEETNEENINLTVTKTTIEDFYDCFPKFAEIDEEARKALIDSIVDTLNDPHRKLIEEYKITGVYRSAGHTLRKVLDSIKNSYLKRVNYYLNPMTKYAEFILVEGFSEEMRKEFVDKLFGTLTDTEKEQIDKCLEGSLSMSEKNFRAAKAKLEFLKKSYNATVKRFLHPLELYEYIFPQNTMDVETKKEIVKTVLAGVSPENISLLEAYLKGTKLFLSSELNKISGMLTQIKLKCRDLQRALFSTEEVSPLMDNFDWIDHFTI